MATFSYILPIKVAHITVIQWEWRMHSTSRKCCLHQTWPYSEE